MVLWIGVGAKEVFFLVGVDYRLTLLQLCSSFCFVAR